MKKIYTLLILLLIFPYFSIFASANDVMNDVQASIDDELNNFKNNLPEEILELIPEDIFENLGVNTTVISEKDFFDYIISYLFANFDEVIKVFSGILILLIISSIFSTLTNSFSNEALKKSFSICSILVVTLTVFNVCISLSKTVSSYLNTLSKMMNAFVPLMTTLSIMNGNISSAVVLNTLMLVLISLIEAFLVGLMLPLVKLCMSFACIKPLGGGNFSGISKTLKTTFTSVTVFVMSIFMFIFTTKNILSQSSDSLTLKTARFAISSFVPLVGASVNEALRTVATSIGLIKNTCGIIGIFCIALLMLPIIMNLFLYKIAFGFLASISKALGCENECSTLEEADSMCGFMLTLIVITCVLFIIALSVFIKNTTGIAVWMLILTQF